MKDREATCPLCGKTVVYIGMNNLECYGPLTCPNRTKKPFDLDALKKEMEQMVTDFEFLF